MVQLHWHDVIDEAKEGDGEFSKTAKAQAGDWETCAIGEMFSDDNPKLHAKIIKTWRDNSATARALNLEASDMKAEALKVGRDDPLVAVALLGNAFADAIDSDYPQEAGEMLGAIEEIAHEQGWARKGNR